MGSIKVGCCGFQVARSKYYRNLKLVEVQKTFYKLPRKETLESWRAEAPEDFEFTVKVWMAFTHDPSSRIWVKSGLPKDEEYGLLRPTEKNLSLWDEFLDLVSPLRPSVFVFQSPPKFDASEENVKNAESFFSTITGGGIRIGWEVRHESWLESGALLRILSKHDIVHVVDPFVMDPLHGDVRYYRLHGRYEGKRIVYSYRYTKEDLNELVSILMRDEDMERYVLFNNSRYSYENALELRKMMEGGQT